MNNTKSEPRLPDITRPDVRAVLVSEWTVTAPELQRTLVDAIVASWEGVSWPPGLLSVSVFASSDGERVLSYAQWASDEAFAEFVEGPCLRQVDRALPGIESRESVAFHLYRSQARPDAPVPRCVVIVSVEFEAPDEQRQRRWVDTVFEALEAETEPHPGGISGHFHVSVDGKRVMNYAEWLDEVSHREALAKSRQDTVGPGPKWREVRSFPGVVSAGYRRYRIVGSLSRSTADQTPILNHA